MVLVAVAVGESSLILAERVRKEVGVEEAWQHYQIYDLKEVEEVEGVPHDLSSG